MTHEGFEAQVDAYLDGELLAGDARALETHLAQCPECTRFRDRRLALRRAAGVALADDVLASHIRSLMPGHLTDVLSSDQHTVKPWFNGRLDFSPAVYDFVGRGYPLLGGRIDYVGGRSVAALVYGRRQHVINVLLWPAARGPAGGPSARTRQGYHELHWTGDYTYWVVSDLGLAELQDFAQLLRQADSTTSVPASR